MLSPNKKDPIHINYNGEVSFIKYLFLLQMYFEELNVKLSFSKYFQRIIHSFGVHYHRVYIFIFFVKTRIYREKIDKGYVEFLNSVAQAISQRDGITLGKI